MFWNVFQQSFREHLLNPQTAMGGPTAESASISLEQKFVIQMNYPNRQRLKTGQIRLFEFLNYHSKASDDFVRLADLHRQEIMHP